MQQRVWDAMSDSEKYKYLRNSELSIKRHQGLRMDAKVGDDDAVATVYIGSVGNVTVTSQCSSQKEAMAEAEHNIEQWNPDKEQE